jgi:alpha-glucosidase
MRVRLLAVAAVFTSYMAMPLAWAQTVIGSAASPGNVLSVDVQLDAMGKLGYDIKRKGKEVIGLSRLGFNLANAYKLDGGFSCATARQRA